MTYAYWYCKVQAIAIEHNINPKDYRAICHVLPDELITAILENKLTDPNHGPISPGQAAMKRLFEEEFIERILLK